MQFITEHQFKQISGGLTDEQSDKLVEKAASSAAKAAFLGALTAAGVISVKTFVITAVGAPVAAIAGTYMLYEHKDYITGKFYEYEIF